MSAIVTPNIDLLKSLKYSNKVIFKKNIIALIDTGCNNTCIDYSVASDLNLIPHDEQVIFTPSGKSNQFLYDATFFFQITGDMPFNLQVCGANLAEQPYDALIGRDFLSLGILIYNGKANRWDFCI